MTRRAAVLAGALVAALALTAVVTLSGVLAAERAGDRARYREALADQRRAAGRSMTARVAPSAPATPPMTFCVRGVDTLVATARARLSRDVLGDDRQLALSEFASMSDLAVRAERYVEQANAGPALRQRMGRVRQADMAGSAGEAGSAAEDKAESAGEASWAALAPEPRVCEDGPAYAMFRLDVPVVAPAPPTKATPTATKAATKAKAKGKPKRKPRSP